MQPRDVRLVPRLLCFDHMKAVVLVAASCLLASTARASPAFTIDIGGQLGGSEGVAGLGGTLGAGQRIFEQGTGSIWVHETVSATALFGPILFGHGDGVLLAGSAGLEFQAATSEGSRTYFLFGLEVGYAHLSYDGVDEGLFGGSTHVSHHERGPGVVVRLGVHFGGETVGVAPVLEIIPVLGASTAVQGGLNLVFGW